MIEGLGLRFGGWRGSQRCLGFGRRGSAGQKMDLFGDGTAQIIERFSNVGRIVVSFVAVLGSVSRLRFSPPFILTGSLSRDVRNLQ